MKAQKIVTLNYENTIPVLFQSKDAWINATAIAKQFGKKPETYLKTERTQEYITALLKSIFNVEKSVALKSATEQNQLVRIVKGGKPENQGTWFHPKLAIDFARWLSADFAVWCDDKIDRLLYPDPNRAKDIQNKRDAHAPMMDALLYAREKNGLQYPGREFFMLENILCNEVLTGKHGGLNEDDLDSYDLKLLKALRYHNGILAQESLNALWREAKLKEFAENYRKKHPRLKLLK